jgi:hypothetical protein
MNLPFVESEDLGYVSKGVRRGRKAVRREGGRKVVRREGGRKAVRREGGRKAILREGGSMPF